MLEIKPIRSIIFVLVAIFYFAVISLFISLYFAFITGDYPNLAIFFAVTVGAVLLVVFMTVIFFRALHDRILIRNDILTYTSPLSYRQKEAPLEKIESAALRCGYRSLFLVLKVKEQERLFLINIVFFRNADIVKLLKEIQRINPKITLSERVKRFIDGKSVYTFGIFPFIGDQ